MNNYPEWWDQTITVYNKYQDSSRRIYWYKTTLENCFWKDIGNKITIGETTIETDNTICRIPKDERFLEKFEWEALTPEEKAEHFCLGTGDIIIRGEIDDEIDEYTQGQRSSDILTKYRKLQGCMLIEKCGINTGTLRGLEHYFVRGV